MNKLPHHFLDSLREEFKAVDYSKWERNKRTNGLKSTKKTKTVHWSSSHPDQKVAKSSHRPIEGQDGNTTHPSEKKHGQLEKSGIAASSSTPSRRTIQKTKKEEKESISRCDQNQTLELLIRLQRQSVEDLVKHCEGLQELNQQMIRDIEDTDRHSFSSATESLIVNQKLRSSVSALKRWHDRQIQQAKSDLKKVEAEEAENHLSAQLKAVTADVTVARAKLYALKTYKDMEYPVKALQITGMKSELEKLKQAQQDEYEEVKRLCQTEMTRLETQLQQRLNEVMSDIAQQKLSQIPPAVKRMALQNRAMKAEIDMHKKMTGLAISTDIS